MVATTIVSAGTVADSPGLGQNRHHFTDSAGTWWQFGFRSASNTTLYARYSNDNGATWNDPTNNTKALAHSNAGHGRCLGVAYRNIASTDVVHIGVFYQATGAAGGTFDENAYIRATLSGTTVTWGTEGEINDSAGTNGASIAAALAIASDGRIIQSLGGDGGGQGGDAVGARSTNADAGSSWTVGYPGTINSVASGTLLLSSVATVSSSGLAALSSGGKAILLADNGSTTGTPNNVVYSLFGGTTWSPANPAGNVFATNVSIDVNDWGFCLRTDTDVHAVRRNDTTSTFTHRRWNGTSWGAGDAIGNNTCKAGAGLAMVSDGTSVWLFIIDSDAANTVRYNKWTSGGGWAGWTAFESTTQVRKFITAAYSSNQSLIGVSWAQTNGANFDVMFEGLSTTTAVVNPPRPTIVSQAVQRAAVR